jgi:hypothetical protein
MAVAGDRSMLWPLEGQTTNGCSLVETTATDTP